MKKIWSWILVAVLVGILGAGSAVYAAGGGSPFQYLLLGPETKVEIKEPINVTWGAVTYYVTGDSLVLWPGQEIAEVPVTIKNISPADWGINFYAQPETVSSDTWPTIEVKLPAEYGYASSLNLGPGESKELLLKVKVDLYSQPATFQGLNIFINYGPPYLPGGKG